MAAFGYKTFSVTLGDKLLQSNLAIHKIVGNGHCLINAIREVLRCNENVDITVNDIIVSLTNELQTHFSDYRDFTTAGFTAEFDKYVKDKYYDSNCVDVCIPALCNALGIRLTLWCQAENGGTLSEIQHTPRHDRSAKYNVCLLRTDSSNQDGRYAHYDAIVNATPPSQFSVSSSADKRTTKRVLSQSTLTSMFAKRHTSMTAISTGFPPSVSSSVTSKQTVKPTSSSSSVSTDTSTPTAQPVQSSSSVSSATSTPTAQPVQSSSSVSSATSTPTEQPRCDSDVNNNACDIPDCWTYDQLYYFKSENSWLSVTNKMLKCTVCGDAKSLGCSKKQGMKLAQEWVNGNISSYGDTRTKQQLSLRKKIVLHKNSDGHKCAESILSHASKGIMAQALAKQHSDLFPTTNRVFRTVYKQVKLNRPFLDFETEIDLQTLNGIEMGRILHSNVSCGNIAVHIGNQMRKLVCIAVVKAKSKFSILIDESTTVSKLSTLIVYIRTQFDETGPLTLFLDLIQLECTQAASIVLALLQCLNVHGLSDEFLGQHWVGLATDGASVMLGKKAGVARMITDKFPHVIPWHCLAHRLELGVHDTLAEVSGTNNFKSFIDKLYSLFSMSPKNRRELRDIGEQLHVQLLSIGRVLDTRWVASSLRTVRAVWESYPALYKHFRTASSDVERDARERSMYSGLADRMSTTEFVQNLALMFDALVELSELSLDLQRRSITVVVAHRSIVRQLTVFEAMCSKSGKHLAEVEEASLVNNPTAFEGVILQSGRKCDVLIRREQFFRSLANNLRNRLLTSQSSHVSSKDRSDAVNYQTLLNKIKLLYPDNWPDTTMDEDALYGNVEVASLAESFQLDARQCVRAFREYRDTGGRKVPGGLQPLLTAVDTIPVCTAECERGYSQMNLIITPTRNSLAVSTVSALLFCKLVGPPLSLFKPFGYVESWIAQGRHAADDTNSMTRDRLIQDSVYRPLWQLL
jgi:hypothetical protein